MATAYDAMPLLDKITDKYGGTIYDKNGKKWDVGQAVCRHLYGEDWSNHPDFIEASLMEYPLIPDEYITAAQEMINEKPEWMEGV